MDGFIPDEDSEEFMGLDTNGGIFLDNLNNAFAANFTQNIQLSQSNDSVINYQENNNFHDLGLFGDDFIGNGENENAQESGHLTLEEELSLLRQQIKEKNEKPSLNSAASNLNRVALVSQDSKDDAQIMMDEYDNIDHGDTYDEYTPKKLRLGLRHPDPVVESSSLSVVMPPDVKYELNIPSEIIDKSLLSALQLEAVVYACQQHCNFLANGSRAGYLIGDGPGVGKGRIISGIIYENMLCKRTKAVWLSVSNDLRYDAVRDLEDIKCDVMVHSFNKISYGDRIEEYFDDYNDVGVLFSTYSSLIGECQSSNSLYKSRMEQLMDWLTPDFDGLIIFDECHKAKNLMPSTSAKPTKTAQNVLKLQIDLPKARVVYCSATGASEPRNMAYMVRLGLWGMGTPFMDFPSFLSSVEKRGVGAMELVAMDMKYRGMYLARQLSFSGVSFAVKTISLTPEFKKMYNDCARFWNKAYGYFQKAADLIGYSSRENSIMMAQFFSAHQRFFKCLCIASKVEEVVSLVKHALQENKCVVIGLQSTGESKTSEYIKEGGMDSIISTAYGMLSSLIDRHFPSLNGFGNGSTMHTFGEGVWEDIVKSEDNGSDDLTPDEAEGTGFLQKPYKPLNGTHQKRKLTVDLPDGKSAKTPIFAVKENPALVAAGLRVNKYNWTSEATTLDSRTNNDRVPTYSNSGPLELCKNMMMELKQDIKILGPLLPPNTLDELIDKLGGTSCVAEMTGRKCRIVRNGSKFIYQFRSSDECPTELVNITEKDTFMDGNKLVAIISEAASAGISLQSDKRVRNQRKRLHITLELSWSADRAIQQFGRTHRSNQVSPPEYLFLISELAGEKRFACVVAKRLESLGALTHGDRRATETRDLSQFNIDTKYGRHALEYMMRNINGSAPSVVELPPYDGDFIADSRAAVTKMLNLDSDKTIDNSKDKENVKINKFLNRILGLEVDLQNAIYQYYVSTLDFFVLEAKRSGKFDFGIIDWGIGDEKVNIIATNKFLFSTPNTGTITAELLSISIQRGVSFEEAERRYNGSIDRNEGFYLSKDARTRDRQIILILRDSGNVKNVEAADSYSICRPNTGFGAKKETIAKLLENYYQISVSMARQKWAHQYVISDTTCTHMYLWGKCKTVERGIECDIGRRTRTIYLFSGAIFTMWSVMEYTFGSTPIRVSRVTTIDGTKRIGILVPKLLVPRLTQKLTVAA